MTNSKLLTNLSFLVLLVLLMILTTLSCKSKSNPVGPPVPVDIFNRFTTETILASDVLPPEITRIRFFPSSDEFIVLSKPGLVSHYVLDEDTATFFGSFEIPGVAPAPSDLGLTDVVFHPEFVSNKLVYFCFTTGDNHWNRILQFTWEGSYADILNSLTIILDVDRVAPEHPWHGIYALAFDDAGNLYASIGDATQPDFAQDGQSLLGKLIRIRPRISGGYDIPGDNPFVGDTTRRDEIVALGLRSPFRLIEWQGKILIGDVGNQYEEINLYSGQASNFGWPECEGVCSQDSFDDPILASQRDDRTFDEEDTEVSSSTRRAMSIGVVYDTHPKNPYDNMLDGRLIFFDIFRGYVRAVEISSDGSLGENKHIFHLETITSMDIGQDGYIYGSTIFDSRVFRIVAKPDTTGE